MKRFLIALVTAGALAQAGAAAAGCWATAGLAPPPDASDAWGCPLRHRFGGHPVALVLQL